VVAVLAKVDEAVDEVLNRPAIVKAFHRGAAPPIGRHDIVTNLSSRWVARCAYWLVPRSRGHSTTAGFQEVATIGVD